jgi:hypothetical protein
MFLKLVFTDAGNHLINQNHDRHDSRVAQTPRTDLYFLPQVEKCAVSTGRLLEYCDSETLEVNRFSGCTFPICADDIGDSDHSQQDETQARTQGPR